MTPIRAAFICSKACDSMEKIRLALPVSIRLVSSIRRHCMIRTWRAISMMHKANHPASFCRYHMLYCAQYSGMFEKTFMWNMFVKLCAWFWPENAKRVIKHLELFFLEWKKPWPSLLQHNMRFGMIVECKKNKGRGLGARRLAPHTHILMKRTHTHTQGTDSNPRTELLNDNQKCGLRPKLLYNVHDGIRPYWY